MELSIDSLDAAVYEAAMLALLQDVCIEESRLRDMVQYYSSLPRQSRGSTMYVCLLSYVNCKDARVARDLGSVCCALVQ